MEAFSVRILPAYALAWSAWEASALIYVDFAEFSLVAFVALALEGVDSVDAGRVVLAVDVETVVDVVLA